MKQTFKKPSYYLLSQAMDGDEKAIEKILAFYDPYISKCCLRPLYDEYGNVYIAVSYTHLSRLLLETMSEINKKMQATILMVTHDPFSASFCERILFLKEMCIRDRARTAWT